MRLLLAWVMSTFIAIIPTRIDAENYSVKAGPVGLIEQFEENNALLNKERIPLYEEELSTSTSPRRRMISALALGLYYLENMQLRIALQYLAIAQELNGQKSGPFVDVIHLGLAKIQFAYGDYESAIKTTKQLMAQNLSRTRTDEAYLIHIKSLYELKRTKDLVTTYDTYIRMRSKSTALAEILKFTAMAYRELNQTEKEQELLESLAEQYPLNPESVWAFTILKNDNCPDSRGFRRYHFSERLLRRLSVNRKLDSALSAFLIDQTNAPLKDRQGRLKIMNLLERVDLILRLELDEEALTFEQELHDLSKRGNIKERPEALILLARIATMQENHQKAARYYNQFLSQYPKHNNRFRVRASLAYTLQKLGAFAAAAENYSYLSQHSRSQIYSWEHFWNTYLAKDYKGALSLLDKPGYIKLKDPQEPLALVYWRARIHDKLGQKQEADRFYRSVLASDATSYYSNLVLAKYPDYWHEMIPEEIRRNTANHVTAPNLKLAAMRFTPSAVTHAPPDDIQLLQELVSAGLEREARVKLNQINERRMNNQQKAEIESLAYYLADYRSFRRLNQDAYDLSNYPKSLTGLVSHTQDHQERWQAHYPLAFDGIIDTVSNYFGVSKFLLLALMRAESHYDVFAQSWVGARGLMQIMPKTALRISELIDNQTFHIDKLYDPSVNLTYGAFYIDLLLKHFQDNPFIAIASYNAGPIAVNKWLRRCQNCEVDEFVETIPFRETRRYVKSVIRYFGQYSRIYTVDQPFWAIPNLPTDLPNDEHLF